MVTLLRIFCAGFCSHENKVLKLRIETKIAQRWWCLSDNGFHQLKIITFIQLHWSDMHTEIDKIQKGNSTTFLPVILPNILFKLVIQYWVCEECII